MHVSFSTIEIERFVEAWSQESEALYVNLFSNSNQVSILGVRIGAVELVSEDVIFLSSLVVHDVFVER